MEPTTTTTTTTTKLFHPLRLGAGTAPLTHRIVMAPLTRFRNHPTTGEPLPHASTYYAQRACAPGTLLIAEACQISPAHGGVPHAPGIYTSEQAAAWRVVTDAVHARGCYIYCQLWAPGRAADPAALPEGAFISASAVAMPAVQGGGFGASAEPAVPRAMGEEEICACITDFASAARRAVEEAGFDGVEVHGANGYLVDQFTQRGSNERADGWGGSVEGRARFAVEVARAVAGAVGRERVGVRLSPWSEFQGMGGMGEGETVKQFACVVRGLRELGIGYLHLVESRVVNNVDVEKKEGIEFALEAWGKGTGPVLVAGGFTPESARRAVDEEYKDYDVAVVFGRSFLANPDLVFRLEKGLPLNAYDRSTFYTPMQEKGYLDYPISEEFKKMKGMA